MNFLNIIDSYHLNDEDGNGRTVKIRNISFIIVFYKKLFRVENEKERKKMYQKTVIPNIASSYKKPAEGGGDREVHGFIKKSS